MRAAPPNIGDLVLVETGMRPNAVPIGAKVIDTIPSDPKRLWLDVCILGQHLPQMYLVKDMQPLTTELAEQFGLCTECMGYGTTSDLDVPLAAGLDQMPDPCPTCTGTGRPAMQVEITRTPSSMEARMIPQPHRPVMVEGFAYCVACGIIPGSGLPANHLPSEDFNP